MYSVNRMAASIAFVVSITGTGSNGRKRTPTFPGLPGFNDLIVGEGSQHRQ